MTIVSLPSQIFAQHKWHLPWETEKTHEMPLSWDLIPSFHEYKAGVRITRRRYWIGLHVFKFTDSELIKETFPFRLRNTREDWLVTRRPYFEWMNQWKWMTRKLMKYGLVHSPACKTLICMHTYAYDDLPTLCRMEEKGITLSISHRALT